MELQKLRIEVDGLYRLTSSLPTSPNLIDVSKALSMAKSWMGRFNSELGNPITDDRMNKSKLDPNQPATAIEYEYNNYNESWSNKSEVKKIEFLGGLIDGLSSRFIGFFGDKDSICVGIIFQHLTEAKFWLYYEMETRAYIEASNIVDETKRMAAREKEINSVDLNKLI